MKGIEELDAVEKEISGHLADEWREVRNAHPKPLLGSLKRCVDETSTTLSRKPGTALAVRYASGPWNVLPRCVDDRRIEIDNSAAEHALSTVALCRKN